jgi:hypothetical protein
VTGFFEEDNETLDFIWTWEFLSQLKYCQEHSPFWLSQWSLNAYYKLSIGIDGQWIYMWPRKWPIVLPGKCIFLWRLFNFTQIAGALKLRNRSNISYFIQLIIIASVKTQLAFIINNRQLLCFRNGSSCVRFSLGPCAHFCYFITRTSVSSCAYVVPPFQSENYVRSKVLTAARNKIIVFWDLTPFIRTTLLPLISSSRLLDSDVRGSNILGNIFVYLPKYAA